MPPFEKIKQSIRFSSTAPEVHTLTMTPLPKTLYIVEGEEERTIQGEVYLTLKGSSFVVERVDIKGFLKENLLYYRILFEKEFLLFSLSFSKILKRQSPSATLKEGDHILFFLPPIPFKKEGVMDRLEVSFRGRFVEGTPHVQKVTLLPKIFIQKNQYQPPVRGEWWVGSGPTLFDHHQRDVTFSGNTLFNAQRYAHDFFQIDNNGNLYKGKGLKNEEYLSFGKKVYAPADGKVVRVLDNIEDNPPGTSNPTALGGNSIVLEHKGGEYTFLGHLKKGSIRVKRGDWLTEGTPIAEVGNSGNSDYPHLHMHVMNGADPFKSDGLPIQFSSFVMLISPDEEVESGLLPVGGLILVP